MKTKALILFFFITTVVLAQKPRVENMPKFDRKPYHFGFCFGFNKYDFTVRSNPDAFKNDSVAVLETIPTWGFNLGVLANLKIGTRFDLRLIPTLTFGDRNLEYTFLTKDTVRIKKIIKIESSILEFPITVKYKSARLNNFRAYVLGGGKYSLDLASQEKKKVLQKDIVKIKRNNLSFEIGFGIDMYFEYFKLSPEVKFSVGVNDLLVSDNTVYTNTIRNLTSKVLFLTFYFE
ncbi:MAG: outer membrane beta-barrel protein [Bacteroidales bacterium]|nr:outer membrane beta-barrel protein [Bacteroidales bacterium]